MTKRVPYVRFVSLGCAKNFVDTEVMAASLAVDGIGLTDGTDEADATVINTCAFIPPARGEALTHIKEALAWKAAAPRKNRKVIVCGCLPQWDKDGAIKAELTDVDLWLGPDESPKLSTHLRRLFEGHAADNGATSSPSTPHFLYDHRTPRLQLTPPHYAYIKIADGCDNHCSYCSIPSIRGHLRCRSMDSVVEEAHNLIRNGVKELILVAQDTTAFGKMKGGKNRETLAELLRRLDAIDGTFWIRTHFLHPSGITDELIDVFAGAHHIITYADMPLQHIAGKILKAMNRKVEARRIKEIITALRARIPRIAIRTTFIVGFPGESEADFAELADFVAETRFERVGVFPYHAEPGTPAATLPGCVPTELAETRQRMISEIHERNSRRLNKSLQGKRIEVLLDSSRGNKFIGRTYMDSPEIDNTVEVSSRSSRLAIGQFASVEITGSTAFSLKAKL